MRRLVAFYVGEHNEKIPRALLRGRTPDELYFGREENLRKRLSEQRKKAQREGPSVPREEYEKVEHARQCGSSVPLFDPRPVPKLGSFEIDHKSAA